MSIYSASESSISSRYSWIHCIIDGQTSLVETPIVCRVLRGICISHIFLVYSPGLIFSIDHLFFLARAIWIGVQFPLLDTNKRLEDEEERQHIKCKPTNLCKLKNYQSGPLDADLMDGVRGLKRKKRPAGGGLKRKKIPPLTPSIGSASSGPDR